MTRSSDDVAVRRHYLETPFGQLHIAECGRGEPVLFLHQTPRSWTEYIDVLPLAGRRVRAIALDTLGFGQSVRIADRYTIELFAEGVLAALTAMRLDTAYVVGHHTGAVIACEVAARAPERVRGLLLSGMPLVTDERRERVRQRAPIDHVDPKSDGSHLGELWRRRGAFYRNGQEASLTRCIADAIAVLDRVEEGHEAVNEYRMEDRLGLIRSPVRIVCGAEDAHSMPDQSRLAELLDAPFNAIEGAGVCSPEQRPDAFADAVLSLVADRRCRA